MQDDDEEPYESDPILWDERLFRNLGDLQNHGRLMEHLQRAMEAVEKALKAARGAGPRRGRPWELADKRFFKRHHAKYADWGLCSWLFAANGLPLTICADCSMPKGLSGLQVGTPHCKTLREDSKQKIEAWLKHCHPFILNICPACRARFQNIGPLLRHLSGHHFKAGENRVIKLLQGGTINKQGFERILAVLGNTDLEEGGIPPLSAGGTQTYMD